MAAATQAKEPDKKPEGISLNGAEFKRKYKVTFSMQAKLRKAHLLPTAKGGKTGRIEYHWPHQDALNKTLAAIKEWREPRKEAPKTTAHHTAQRTRTAA